MQAILLILVSICLCPVWSVAGDITAPPAAGSEASPAVTPGEPPGSAETIPATPGKASEAATKAPRGDGQGGALNTPGTTGQHLQNPVGGATSGPPGGLNPPRDSAKNFVDFMKKARKEEERFLQQRFQRCNALIQNKDLSREAEIRAFLLTPREKFCRSWNLGRAYDHAFMDIHYGVTISGPHLVGRMTSALQARPGDKVLEIGTGSGYQAALLAYLTDQVYTIEIIEPLAKETDRLFSDLAAAGYPEFAAIKRKADDGYYGWEEHAPFDKIIVTCGIDHIPPPLLKQLKVGGILVIPVGPPGAQVILKVTKNTDDQGNLVIAREDIYHGRKKEAFVPFTNKDGGTHFK